MGEIRINDEVYGTSVTGVDLNEISELFYGSMTEREAIADAITEKGVNTNTSDSLFDMAENIGKIKTLDKNSVLEVAFLCFTSGDANSRMGVIGPSTCVNGNWNNSYAGTYLRAGYGNIYILKAGYYLICNSTIDKIEYRYCNVNEVPVAGSTAFVIKLNDI